MFSPDCYESKKIVDLVFIAGLDEEIIKEAIKDSTKMYTISIEPKILFKYPPNNEGLTDSQLPVRILYNNIFLLIVMYLYTFYL